MLLQQKVITLAYRLILYHEELFDVQLNVISFSLCCFMQELIKGYRLTVVIN